MLNLTITRGFYQPRRHTQNRKYITIALPSEKDWSTATGNMYRKFVELGRAFLRYPIGAYKQTYRQVDRNTSPTYRGRSKERKYNTVHCVSKIKWLLITTFDDNFGKCRPIYKVFFTVRFLTKFCTHISQRLSTSIKVCFYTTCKLITIAAECRFLWHIAQETLEFFLARYEAALIALV